MIFHKSAFEYFHYFNAFFWTTLMCVYVCVRACVCVAVCECEYLPCLSSMNYGTQKQQQEKHICLDSILWTKNGTS